MSSGEITGGDTSDPKASTTVYVGVIGTILFLAVVLFAQALFQNAQWLEDQRKVYAPRNPRLLEVQTQQLGTLNGYRLVSAAEGRVTIPIDRAIELVLPELKSGATASTIPATSPSQPQEGLQEKP
jgi:hypothetical protein